MRRIYLVMFIIFLSSCNHLSPDLNAPCPDYGRYCPQIILNAD